jgi:hypothetical protein
MEDFRTVEAIRPPQSFIGKKKKRGKMADSITVVELAKPSGVSQDWPQPYEITVTPGIPGGSVPVLPFMHKDDGITVEDGTTYWISRAKQVPLKGFSGPRWSWVYEATRDTSNDSEGRPW